MATAPAGDVRTAPLIGAPFLAYPVITHTHYM